MICLVAFVNGLPAFPICLVRPSMPPPVPGTFTPSTRFGLRASLLPSTTPPTRPATVPTPASKVPAPFEAAFPFEDPDAPPLSERAVALPPFWLRARVRELVAREPLALAPELFDLALDPPDLLRAPLALPFEALAPFFAFEPPDDVREGPAEDDFR